MEKRRLLAKLSKTKKIILSRRQKVEHSGNKDGKTSASIGMKLSSSGLELRTSVKHSNFQLCANGTIYRSLPKSVLLASQSVHQTQHRSVHGTTQQLKNNGSVLIQEESQGQFAQSGCPFSHLFRAKLSENNERHWTTKNHVQQGQSTHISAKHLKNVPGPRPLPYFGTMHKYLPHFGKHDF